MAFCHGRASNKHELYFGPSLQLPLVPTMEPENQLKERQRKKDAMSAGIKNVSHYSISSELVTNVKFHLIFDRIQCVNILAMQ